MVSTLLRICIVPATTAKVVVRVRRRMRGGMHPPR